MHRVRYALAVQTILTEDGELTDLITIAVTSSMTVIRTKTCPFKSPTIPKRCCLSCRHPHNLDRIHSSETLSL